VNSKAECNQLNPAHIARNKKSIKRNKNKRQCPLNLAQVVTMHGLTNRPIKAI